MAGGKPIFGIAKIGNKPYYNPFYPRMASNFWKPTFPIQTGSSWDRLLNSQPVSSLSQIPTLQFVPQQAQIYVIQPLQDVITSQYVPSAYATLQVPLTQPLQGTLQSQPLGQGIPQILVGETMYSMAQHQFNPP